MSDVFDMFGETYNRQREDEMDLMEYLEACRDDPMMYATAAERMVKAIGEPEIIDTSRDPRLSRIFLNRTVKRYAAFEDFYGMEDAIERIVGYFRYSAQGLEEKKQILYLLGPAGGGKCHRAGTKISMANGSHCPIEQLRVGDYVLSLDEDHKVTSRRISNTFTLEPKRVVEVVTTRGIKVASAETHRLLSDVGWKQIADFRPGDFVATARRTTFGGIRCDHNEAKILGYLIGDGHIPLSGSITFTNFNPEIVEDFTDAVIGLSPNSKVGIQKDKNKQTDYYRILEGYHQTIRQIIEPHGLLGTHSHTKFVPTEIFLWDEEGVATFLSRLYATDGWATVGSRCEIGYTTVSEDLARDVVALLSKFGIPARLSWRRAKCNGEDKRVAYTICVKDRNDIGIFMDRIGIFGKSMACEAVREAIARQRGNNSGSLDRIPKKIIRDLTEDIPATKKNRTSKMKNQLRNTLRNDRGCRRDFVMESSTVAGFEALRKVADSDIYWDEIKEIRYLSDVETMYDIEVDGFHNYIADGVVSHNSSIAERLKALMEVYPIYALKAGDQVSPVFESPLGLFSRERFGSVLEEKYGIPARYLTGLISPWAVKRLDELDGDIRRFKVVRLTPSKLRQIAVVKTEPGDENNQDISSLVGKVDIRKLEHYSQNDPDCYSFSGALCRGNQGIMEFVEMFKAPIKVLHPLLTATQEGNYIGTESLGAIPFNGMVLAHCFSDDTEILTIDGFKRHDEIEIGDLLATMNRETGKLEYQPALTKFEQDYNGPMYHFCSSAADHLVTPNHKMLYHTQYTTDWRMVTAEEFGETGKIIPVSAENDLDDYPIADDMLRLMVWVVADGSLISRKVRFHLKKERKIERLTALLSKMGIAFSRADRAIGTVDVRFDNPGLTKEIPPYYNRLSARQARIVLDEYMHTDGCRTSENHCQLSSNNRQNIDRLHHLAIASGCKANMSSAQKGRYSPQYFLSVRLDVTETRADHIRKQTTYSGTVFCFETPNHTLVARRNGKVIITQNSNMAEWQQFKSNKNNEAFLDRICVIKVPYCLRVAEEVKIYRKLLKDSSLFDSACAPQTLDMLAQFCVLTRLKEHENSSLFSKLRVYDGENTKDTDVKAKTMHEYRDAAGVDEGMTGISTRFAFKILSQTFNYDTTEVAADPVHLMYILEMAIKREQFSEDLENQYLEFIKEELAPRYAEFIGNEIQKAYLESYSDYGQNLFDRYIEYADHWIQDTAYKDPDTGQMFDRDILNGELEKIEKPAGIANPKDFRHEVVNFVLRARANNNGKNPLWTSYEKMCDVIEKKMFSTVSDLLPVISFGTKKSKEEEKKHDDFVARMQQRGYSERQTRRLVEWYMRVQKSA